MYQINKDSFGSFERYILINENTGEEINVLPEYGAVITSVKLKKADNLHEIIFSEKTSDELLKNCCHRGAKLIPFPNRINDGRYEFDSNSYQLSLNLEAEKHAIHGFVYDKPFKVTNLTTESNFAKIDMEYNYDGNKNGYPFKFKVSVNYILCNEGIRVNTLIINTCEKKLPIGDGWHPYFCIEQKINGLKLKIPSHNKIEVNERMIPTGRTKEYNRFQEFETIENTTFDTGFIIDDMVTATTSLYSPKFDTTINFWQDSEKGKYTYLQIYTPPDRKSIAIEPMTCMTDAFNNKVGLIELNQGDSFSGSYGVYLS